MVGGVKGRDTLPRRCLSCRVAMLNAHVHRVSHPCPVCCVLLPLQVKDAMAAVSKLHNQVITLAAPGQQQGGKKKGKGKKGERTGSRGGEGACGLG